MHGSKILQALLEYKEKYAWDKSLIGQCDTSDPRPVSDSAALEFDPVLEFTKLSVAQTRRD